MPNNRHAIIIVMYICQDMSGWENVTVSWVLLNSLYVFFFRKLLSLQERSLSKRFQCGFDILGWCRPVFRSDSTDLFGYAFSRNISFYAKRG